MSAQPGSNARQTFEARYGAGSYDAGLNKARTYGKTQAQADFEKQEYEYRMKMMMLAQEEAYKAAEEQAQADAESAGIEEAFQQYQQQAQATAKTPQTQMLDEYMFKQVPLQGPVRDEVQNADIYQKKLNKLYSGGLLKDSLTPKSPFDPTNKDYLTRQRFMPFKGKAVDR